VLTGLAHWMVPKVVCRQNRLFSDNSIIITMIILVNHKCCVMTHGYELPSHLCITYKLILCVVPLLYPAFLSNESYEYNE